MPIYCTKNNIYTSAHSHIRTLRFYIQKIFLCFATLLLSCAASIAQSTKPEMADGLKSSGKIYVVVAVVLTVLAGLFLYIWKIDCTISKLENKK